MINLLRFKGRNGQKGQAVAEFALVLPIMLLILFSIVEFGRAVMTWNVVTGAAREGARVGATSSSGFSEAHQAASNVLNAAGINNFSISVSGPDGNNNVNCNVRATHTVLTGSLIPGFNGQITISHNAVMRWEG